MKTLVKRIEIVLNDATYAYLKALKNNRGVSWAVLLVSPLIETETRSDRIGK